MLTLVIIIGAVALGGIGYNYHLTHSKAQAEAAVKADVAAVTASVAKATTSVAAKAAVSAARAANKPPVA
jgi:flagellar basal body-associated protein FliL